MKCVHCCARLIASARRGKAQTKAMAKVVEDSIRTLKSNFTMDDVREEYKRQTEAK